MSLQSSCKRSHVSLSCVHGSVWTQFSSSPFHPYCTQSLISRAQAENCCSHVFCGSLTIMGTHFQLYKVLYKLLPWKKSHFLEQSRWMYLLLNECNSADFPGCLWVCQLAVCEFLCLQNELGMLPWAIVAINELGMYSCACVSCCLARSASLLYLTNMMQEEYFLFLAGSKWSLYDQQ